MKQETVIRAELPAQLTHQIPTIQSLLLYLEGKGRSENTRIAYEKNLKALALRADLNDTKAVELAIARYTKKSTKRPVTNNYKSKLCDQYAIFCKFYKIEWEKPIYTPEPTTIQPPTHEKVQMLVASARGKLSIKLDIIQQTGLRPIEITGEKGLQVNNIHPDHNTITARITKGCNPRPPLNITPELMAKLQAHIRKYNLEANDLLFTAKPREFGSNYRNFRNRLAKKLNDETIHNTRLYDLRHYYVTNKLRKIQNTEIVRQLVGHKNLNTTQKYMHLLAENNGEWIVESTQDQKRADELLKADFTYILTTPDGYMKFRKPK
jgi:integrase